MSENTTPLSPPPVQTSPSESVAAPAEVGQVAGTTLFVLLLCFSIGLLFLFIALLVNFPNFTVGLVVGSVGVQAAWRLWKVI